MKADVGISRKAILASVMALAAFVLRAGTVYDAGEAMIEALDKGATSGVVTDCHGATWTFGSLTSADLNAIEPLPGVYRDNGFCGFTPANGSAGVPFAIVNTTNEPLTHGGETGWSARRGIVRMRQSRSFRRMRASTEWTRRSATCQPGRAILATV